MKTNFILPVPSIPTLDEKMVNQKPLIIDTLMIMLKNKILTNNCPLHNTRVIDQVCLDPLCNVYKRTFCSKCLLQDELHSHNHKSYLKDIEVFLQERVKTLSGLEFSLKIEDLYDKIEKIKEIIKNTLNENVKKMETDFREIFSNLQSFFNEIIKDLKNKTNNYIDEFEDKLKIRENKLNIVEKKLNVEQSYELNSIKQLLECVDSSKESQIGYFLLKLETRTTNFSIENDLNVIEQEMNSVDNFIKENCFYNQESMSLIKNTIYSLLEKKWKNNEIMKFDILKPFELLNNYKKNEKQKSEDNESISFLKQIETSHKLPINSIELYNNSIIITNSNDRTLRLWSLNPGFIIIPLSIIKLEGLCLSFKLDESKSLLYISNGRKIDIYSIENPLKPIKKEEIIVHNLQIRAIELLQNFNCLISCSHDKTLNVVNLNPLSIFSSINVKDSRILISNNINKICLCANDGSLKIWEIETNKNLKCLIELNVSKHRLSYFLFCKNNENLGFCSDWAGLIYIINFYEGIITKKIKSDNSTIYFMYNFLNNSNEFIFILNWKGNAEIINISKDNIVSNTNFGLKYDKEKHLNWQGSKFIKWENKNIIITTGNDDKKLVFLQLNN